MATEWQDDNNNNGEDDGEDEMDKDADAEVDELSNMSEEMPAISLPGHTAAPLNYEGPEFPVRDLQPLPHSPPARQNSDELASRIKQADVLQTEVVNWSAYSVA